MKLAEKLTRYGIKVIGTSYDALDLAEDRGEFSDLLKRLNIPYPDYGVAHSAEEALKVAHEVGYPVLVRPSYVLGGQQMRIVINDEELERAVLKILKNFPENTILIDHFLDRAEEAEVDAISDGDEDQDDTIDCALAANYSDASCSEQYVTLCLAHPTAPECGAFGNDYCKLGSTSNNDTSTTATTGVGSPVCQLLLFRLRPMILVLSAAIAPFHFR